MKGSLNPVKAFYYSKNCTYRFIVREQCNLHKQKFVHHNVTYILKHTLYFLYSNKQHGKY